MPRRYCFLLILICLAGAWLRLWQLDTVPAGLHYDAAIYALQSQAIAFYGDRPILASVSHEVLFLYWTALWFRLIGPSVFALRLASALAGVLTIPATFFVVRQALRRESHARGLALFAASLISQALFHVIFSRFGFRVVTEPLLQALALGFLFRGVWKHSAAGNFWQRGGLDFACAGVFTGLTAHTYIGARFFVLPLAAFWVAWLVVRRADWRTAVGGLGIFTLTAFSLFAPLGYYFLQHPADFFMRVNQVAPRADQLGLLLESAVKVGRMVFIKGDPYYRYNLVDLPWFNLWLGFLFCAGWLATVYRCFRAPPGAQRALEVLLSVWLPCMLLPAVLAVNEIVPSNLRAFGVLPLVFVFPARGLGVCLAWMQARLGWPSRATGNVLLGCCWVAGGLGLAVTAHQYFGLWQNQAGQYQENEADLRRLAEYLNQHPPGEAALFVTSRYYQHPTLDFLMRDSSSIRWLAGGAALARPAGQAVLYISTRSAPLPAAWTQNWQTHREAVSLGPDGVPDFEVYRFGADEPVPLPEFTRLSEAGNFGNLIFLEGYRVEAGTAQAEVVLRWRVENPAEQPDLLPYLRLYPETGQSAWAQSDNFTYPSGQWQMGELLFTRHQLPLPAGMPPGRYVLKVGLYAESASYNLPHLNAAGAFAGDRMELGRVELAGNLSASETDLRAQNRIQAPLENTGLAAPLNLLGCAPLPASIRQGDWLPLTLFWSGTDPGPAAPLTITLGETEIYTGQLIQSGSPFVLQTRYRLRLPVNMPAGAAELRVTVPGYGRAVLARLEISAVERQWEAPPAAQAVRYMFQNQIALTGYTLTPGVTTTLALNWQALQMLADDYTVFVHVLDANGQTVAQADAFPRQGAYPTSLWEPEEYIAEAYSFNLPSGQYTLQVGLYLAETGERLKVTAADGQALGDQVQLADFAVP